jgi:hypothetical protein
MRKKEAMKHYDYVSGLGDLPKIKLISSSIVRAD